MNSAPASKAARAVSGSRTVPAPIRTRLPNSFLTAATISRAPGTVNVTSIMSIPPSKRARATLVNCSLDGARRIATIPVSRTRLRFSLPLIRSARFLSLRVFRSGHSLVFGPGEVLVVEAL